MYTFNIPAALTPMHAVNFANYIDECPDSSEYIYDFNQMQHCKPYGLLIIASAIRRNKQLHPNSEHKIINYTQSQGAEFAAEFGFFQSIGENIGIERHEDEVGFRYIPIKKITAQGLHAQYTGTTLLNAKVESHASALASTLIGESNLAMKETLQYCFREMIRNTFEHACVHELWVCAQYWPTRREAELAILDEGIGIFESLKANPRIHVTSCSEANKLALQPGFTRTLGMKQDPFDEWQNSGYGLYVASSLAAMTGGYLFINSGDNAILVNAKTQNEYFSSHHGTAICINLKLDNPRLDNFDNVLKQIVAEGEMRAAQNGESRVLTASKVTTIASMVRHIGTNKPTENNKDQLCQSELCNGIPKGQRVKFCASNLNKQKDLIGEFSYNNVLYRGILRNVSIHNKSLYIANRVPVPATIKGFDNGFFTLIEASQRN